MEKKMYITEDEREKCKRVADAYEEIYDDEEQNIVVLDAGRYGYIKLQYYNPPYGFNDMLIFTDNKELFEDLWEDWLNTQLFELAKGTELIELDYEDIFVRLPEHKQKELMSKKDYFAKKAGMTDVFLES